MILLISDVQCHYEVINRQIRHATDELGAEVEQVVVLGDFGFFRPHLRDAFRRDGLRFERPVSVIEGNHEDFGELPELAREFADVLTYLPRATLARFDPWGILCLGGARYMDSHSTPRGCEVSPADIGACLAHEPDRVDLVVSHDCPAGLGIRGESGLEHFGPPGIPGSDRIFKRLQPRMWFFGHHHRWYDHTLDQTRFIGLPVAWFGYCLLDDRGDVRCVERKLNMPDDPWWLRIFGMR